jgi:effector-binding domain-containing protein
MQYRMNLLPIMMLGGLIMAIFISTDESRSAGKFYSRTPSGEIEIKTIPESRVLIAESKGSYFEISNQLFSRLFNYIKEHEIPMTAPVEGSLEGEARMVFYVGTGIEESRLSDEGEVSVLRLPERLVAAIGARGSYSEKNIRKNLDKLDIYMADQNEYEVNGSPYAVYWNPPFIPWFLRHLEVHIPVRPRKSHQDK